MWRDKEDAIKGKKAQTLNANAEFMMGRFCNEDESRIYNIGFAEGWNAHIERCKDIPSVEPWDLYNPDEWCTDCKEYDTENHRCPRWNKMIRRTIEENKVVNCCGCVHWVNDVANPDRMMCKELKIPTEDFFFCKWGEREGADDDYSKRSAYKL